MMSSWRAALRTAGRAAAAGAAWMAVPLLGRAACGPAPVEWPPTLLGLAGAAGLFGLGGLAYHLLLPWARRRSGTPERRAGVLAGLIAAAPAVARYAGQPPGPGEFSRPFFAAFAFALGAFIGLVAGSLAATWPAGPAHGRRGAA